MADKPIRALTTPGMSYSWDFSGEGYDENVSLETILIDLYEKIKRLEGAYVRAELVIPDE